MKKEQGVAKISTGTVHHDDLDTIGLYVGNDSAPVRIKSMKNQSRGILPSSIGGRGSDHLLALSNDHRPHTLAGGDVRRQRTRRKMANGKYMCSYSI